MGFTRRKVLMWVLLLGILLPGCSDFRAIFNGKPNTKIAKGKKKNVPKNRDQNVPENMRDYFSWPLQAPLSSLYGPRGGRFHDGIDIDGESGDPVVAAASGTVVYSDKLGGYGRLVVVRHDNGYFSAYAHNKKNLVEKGKKVQKGDLIAYVGDSGSTTGDHLHFEIRDQNGTYDPLDFLPRERYSQRK